MKHNIRSIAIGFEEMKFPRNLLEMSAQKSNKNICVEREGVELNKLKYLFNIVNGSVRSGCVHFIHD